MLSKPSSYAKAIVSTLVAIAGTLVVVLDDGSMTWGDAAKVFATAVAAFGATYGVSNAEPSTP